MGKIETVVVKINETNVIAHLIGMHVEIAIPEEGDVEGIAVEKHSKKHGRLGRVAGTRRHRHGMRWIWRFIG